MGRDRMNRSRSRRNRKTVRRSRKGEDGPGE